MADTDEMFERVERAINNAEGLFARMERKINEAEAATGKVLSNARTVLAEARVVYLERQLKERDELVERLKRRAQNNIDRAFNRGVDAAFDAFMKDRGITLTLAELDKLFRDVRYVDEFGDDTAKGDD